ncbi:MAG: AAA family ATPase [Bacteroidales bacterium]|nr:AAA family ATPase [Bacteroidales bacterium]
MESLIESYKSLLYRTDTTFIRYLHDQINWQSRLVALLGTRGVGKTTMILQHIKLHDNPDQSLYVLADDFYFASHRLFDLAQDFYRQGGKKLYIDEIHKYRNWSVEIKNIYDKLPDLQVVYTGSSILDLEQGGADLSRRKIEYVLPGLSLREYINITHSMNLAPHSLTDILHGDIDFPLRDLRPLQLLADYMKTGYYPFFRDDDYMLRLNGILKQVVEFDIPQFADFNAVSILKLKKLIYMLAQSVPFKPNYSKLERDLDIRRNTLPTYMHLLEKAGLISLLPEKSDGIKLLEKIDKVYLQNPNIAHTLSASTPDKGSLRESMFLAWMNVGHRVTASPVADFEIDGLTFEVGGKGKSRRQLATLDPERAYVVKDDIEHAALHSIPLWMFGFIY